MNEIDYQSILSINILTLRKERGLTQEQLAEKLNISFQAVSKWENGQSSPDIILLPVLADIFDVSIDRLFGRSSSQTGFSIPWDDDDTIHGMIFKGREVLSDSKDLTKFTFMVEGDVLNVQSNCNVSCGSVQGKVGAGMDVNCGNVRGDVTAGMSIYCGNIEKDANAGVEINCGNIAGKATAGMSIHTK